MSATPRNARSSAFSYSASSSSHEASASLCLQSPSGPRANFQSPKRQRQAASACLEADEDPRSPGSARHRQIMSKKREPSQILRKSTLLRRAFADTDQFEVESPVKRTRTVDGYAGHAPRSCNIERMKSLQSAATPETSAIQDGWALKDVASEEDLLVDQQCPVRSGSSWRSAALAVAAVGAAAAMTSLGFAHFNGRSFNEPLTTNVRSDGIVFGNSAPKWQRVLDDIRQDVEPVEQTQNCPGNAPHSASVGATGSVFVHQSTNRASRGRVELGVAKPRLEADATIADESGATIFIALNDMSFGHGKPVEPYVVEDVAITTHPVLADLLSQIEHLPFPPAATPTPVPNPDWRGRAPVAADYIGTMYADFDLFGPITLSVESSSQRPRVESASQSPPSILVLQSPRTASIDEKATSFMAGTRSVEHILQSADNIFAPGKIEIDPQPLVFSSYAPTQDSPSLSKRVDELLFDNYDCDCGASSSMVTSTDCRFTVVDERVVKCSDHSGDKVHLE